MPNRASGTVGMVSTRLEQQLNEKERNEVLCVGHDGRWRGFEIDGG
jgi:hypothetical protein